MLNEQEMMEMPEAYEPPRLEEFGQLRQLIRGAGSGDYDNQACVGPPIGGAVREDDCP